MTTIWSDTLLLMILGMGTVFVFLLLLIIALYVMAKIIAYVSPEDNIAIQKNTIAAVAAAAFKKHKNIHHNQPENLGDL